MRPDTARPTRRPAGAATVRPPWVSEKLPAGRSRRRRCPRRPRRSPRAGRPPGSRTGCHPTMSVGPGHDAAAVAAGAEPAAAVSGIASAFLKTWTPERPGHDLQVVLVRAGPAGARPAAAPDRRGQSGLEGSEAVDDHDVLHALGGQQLAQVDRPAGHGHRSGTRDQARRAGTGGRPDVGRVGKILAGERVGQPGLHRPAADRQRRAGRPTTGSGRRRGPGPVEKGQRLLHARRRQPPPPVGRPRHDGQQAHSDGDQGEPADDLAPAEGHAGQVVLERGDPQARPRRPRRWPPGPGRPTPKA